MSGVPMMRYEQANAGIQQVIMQSAQAMPNPVPSPTLSNDNLAMQLQHNWLSKNSKLEHLVPAAGANDSLDDSLTSLNWLHNMNLNLGSSQSTPPHSPRPGGSEAMRVNPNQVLATNFMHHPSPLLDIQLAPLNTSINYEKIDYKSNPYVKPPYSYATLICMAMKSSKKNKVTLSAIYSWITENFMFYRMAEPSWQNSIRHNLSLNKCFQKVARRKDEPGKGGFWRINPEYSALLDNGVLKKKFKSIDLGCKRSSTEDADDVLYGILSSKRRSKQFAEDEDEDAALALAKYLNFDRLLNQDIDVNGIQLKTEDIIDAANDSNDSLVALSPPSSDSTSEDSFEDLLGSNLAGLDEAQAGTSNMAVQGVKIEPPEWWTDSLSSSTFNGLLNSSIPSGQLNSAAPSTHPWSTNKSDIDDAMAALDDMEKFLTSSFN